MKYLIIIGFTIAGFFIGYLTFGQLHGVDLSISDVILGVNTKMDIVNNIGNDILSSTRQKILVTTIVGFFAGVAVYYFILKNSKR